MKTRNVTAFVLCLLITFSAFSAYASAKLDKVGFVDTASGKTFKYMFDDAYSVKSKVFGMGTYSGPSADTAYKGTHSYKIKITKAADRSWTNLAREIYQGMDMKNGALEFAYKPVAVRDEVYAGISCFTDSTNKNAVLRILLNDYIDLANYDYENGGWINVTIPFEYFRKNGEFINLGDGEIAEFDFNRLNGVYFEYSKENLTADQTIVAYVDEIRMSECVNSPEIIGASYSDGLTLVWENLGENTVYEVYRNGYLKAKLSENYYHDTDCKKNKTYEYAVRAKRDGMVSLPSVYTADTSFAVQSGVLPDGKLGVKNAVCTVGGNRAVIYFDKRCSEDMAYVLYKNGTAYAKSDIEFFVDKAYANGDVYKIISYSADKTRVSAVDSVEVKEGAHSAETGNIKLLDLNGANAKNGAVKYASFDVVNKSAEKFGALAVAAFYKDGHLYSADTQNITLLPGTKNYKITLANPPILNGTYEFAVFLLDELSVLQPVAPKSAQQYKKSSGDGEYNIALNNSDEKQTITGWGISPFSIPDFKMFQNTSDWQEVFDLTYRDLGLNIIRLPFNSYCGDGGGNIVESELEVLANYANRAAEYGITDYMMTYWSAPADMIEIEEGGINYGTGNCQRLKVDCEEKYCDYIVKCIAYLNEHCANPPLAVSLQNEPQDGRTMPRYDKEQYMRVSKLLRNKLNSAGFEGVKILGPETAAYYQMYIQMGGKLHNLQFANFAEDKEFADAIGIIGVHSYAMKIGDRSYHTDIEQFANAASDYPDKERWQTEFSESNKFETNMDASIYTMRILSADVGWAGMNRWFYWRSYYYAYTTDENGITYDVYNMKYSQQSLIVGTPGGKLKTTKLYNSLKTLFKNAPAGSKVVTASCSDGDVDNASALYADLLAFKTEKGSMLMLVNKSDSEKVYNISNLIGGRAVIKYVSEDSEDIVTTDKIEIENSSINGICVPKKSIMYVICE